jgi:hypothetical protein
MAYNSLGCFPLGSDSTPLAFAEIVQSQQRLKSLNLLHPVPTAKIQSIGLLLRQFYDSLDLSEDDNHLASTIKELANWASNDLLHVNLCLDSGLRKSSDFRFWAVFVDGP